MCQDFMWWVIKGCNEWSSNNVEKHMDKRPHCNFPGMSKSSYPKMARFKQVGESVAHLSRWLWYLNQDLIVSLPQSCLIRSKLLVVRFGAYRWKQKVNCPAENVVALTHSNEVSFKTIMVPMLDQHDQLGTAGRTHDDMLASVVSLYYVNTDRLTMRTSWRFNFISHHFVSNHTNSIQLSRFFLSPRLGWTEIAATDRRGFELHHITEIGISNLQTHPNLGFLFSYIFIHYVPLYIPKMVVL